MDFKTRRILRSFMKGIKDRLKEAVPRVTGKTRKSITQKSVPDGEQIWGGRGVEALEYPRGPYAGGQERGLWKALQTWLAAKGLEDTESRARSLAYMINKQGQKGYKQGRTGIISGVINENQFKSLLNELGEHYAVTMASDVLRNLKHLRVIK